MKSTGKKPQLAGRPDCGSGEAVRPLAALPATGILLAPPLPSLTVTLANTGYVLGNVSKEKYILHTWFK